MSIRNFPDEREEHKNGQQLDLFQLLAAFIMAPFNGDYVLRIG
ncbi:hypothetical protein lacNasYZ03_17790 [Lactobacillus nasalidis]|uniref:Uncharacterized protein n=1 Tax=Lactobacillus nasalidis TaxID=2797258 RepID=A0ABQ3WD01_9LACO|nr:hypothetical protein [Lactobacillus nasalidis]GHV96978.1 hypothetical protein lacNasYZ01_01600 [Lactobacillus nasalidis]GHV98585.1 hypothetical protein lacNasYZ02_00150 [Lactobacillus nasalidis]GHW02092.1 hypothetical protein lacNasYZ03_17790 [Lactobacillus nasalidis]